jgi:protoporphyrinogen/coproporphyrinogen III oxidase
MNHTFSEQQDRVAVIGSGAAGLAATYALQQRGHVVDVFEREQALGGRFGVASLGDRPVMLGGKNIGKKYTRLRSFVAAHGDHRWEPFGINASRVVDGRILTVDSSRRVKSLFNLARMGVPRDLARFGRLAASVRRSEKNRFLGSPLAAELSRDHDHAPLSEHFGDAFTRSLIRAMTIRTNGAEPDESYLGTFNTNVALLMDTYDQLTDGIQPVLEAFSATTNVRLGTTVTSLVVDGARVRGVRSVDCFGTEREEEYAAVVMAVPAHAAAKILSPTHPLLAEKLDGVQYFPATVALVQYDAPVFTPQVRAIALDGGPCSNAGSYGMDDRDIVRYTFSGAHARHASPSQDQIDQWVDDAERVLAQYLPVASRRRVHTVTRHWPTAFCAYVPFHADFLSSVVQEAGRLSGLALAGDYLRGVSLEGCFRSGEDAAASVPQAVAHA